MFYVYKFHHIGELIHAVSVFVREVFGAFVIMTKRTKRRVSGAVRNMFLEWWVECWTRYEDGCGGKCSFGASESMCVHGIPMSGATDKAHYA